MRQTLDETMVQSLMPYRKKALNYIQNDKSPRLYDLGLSLQDTYFYNGEEIFNYNDTTSIFLVYNLPYKFTSNKNIYNETMHNGFIKKYYNAFLIFLNGKFIPWDNIRVVHDTMYDYIIIEGYHITYKDKFDCIVIPNIVNYTTRYEENEDNLYYCFDKDNLLSFSPIEDAKCIKFSNNDLFHDSSIINSNDKIAINISPDYKLNKDNIFIFKDGLLDTATEFVLDNYNTITILGEEGERYRFIALCNKNANKSRDVVNNFINQKNVIKNILSEKDPNKILDIATNEFNFEFDTSISREENISNSLKYIMAYNPDLLSQFYDDKRNIHTINYKGSNLLNNAVDGYICVSRRYKNDMSNHIMVFRNGRLLENHSYIKYNGKDISIPISYIEADDNIEILYFSKCENRFFKLKTSYKAETEIIDPSIDMKHMKMFTIDPVGKVYNIRATQSANYEIPFTYEEKSIGKYRIVTDNIYMNTDVYMVSDRQFNYMRYVPKKDCVSIVLSDSFRYSIDDRHYMVFINGSKISPTHLRFTTPKITRPFDKIVLYSNIPFNKGDVVDIFYTPEVLDELEYTNEVTNQTITIDRDKLTYALNPELYLFFLNGKKVSTKDLVYLDSNRVKLNLQVTDYKLANVSIIKHISDIDVLTELFKNNDYISSALSKLSNNDINELYDIIPIMSNREVDEESKAIDMKSVMFEIIKDFWCKPTINKGEPFLYDYFDQEFIDNLDEDSNLIIEVLNASKEDKINYETEEELN